MRNERADIKNQNIQRISGLNLALERILRNLSNGVLLLDSRGLVALCNQSAEQILELKREALLEQPFPPPSAEFSPGIMLESILQKGEPFHSPEQTIAFPNGERKYIDLQLTPIFSADRHIEGVIVDLRDRTAPQKAHDERERLLAELDATINAINDAVILYKPSGDIVRMNPVARRLLDYDESTERNPLGKRLGNVKMERPDGAPLPLEHYLLRVLKGDSFHGILGVMKRASGEDTWLQLSAAPVFSAQREIIAAVGTATDVTALHRADEERIRGLLMLTHDFRNPLTVIQGHTQLIEARIGKTGTDELRCSLDAIHDAVGQMSSMLTDLLSLARIEGDKTLCQKVDIDLRDFIRRFFDTNCVALDCDRIEVEMSGTPQALPANPQALERILLNLLSNALKYSPQRSRVQLRVHPDTTSLKFTVMDQGNGIAREDHCRLFRCFGRLPNKVRDDSLGIGLYVARRLVEAQGGRIWVESDKGQGAAFHFTLPTQE